MVSNDKGTHELIDDIARRQQIREIELELIRVRAGAEAARLEARAAELELLLRRMTAGSDVDLPKSHFAGLVAQGGLLPQGGMSDGTATSGAAAITAGQINCEPMALPEGFAEPTNPHLGHEASAHGSRNQTVPSTQPAAPLTGSHAEPPNRWSSRLSRMQSRDRPSALPSFNTFASVPAKPVDPQVNYGSPAFLVTAQNEAGIWQRSDPGSNPIRAPHFSTPHFGERTEPVVEKHGKTIAPELPSVVEQIQEVSPKDTTPVSPSKPSITSEAATNVAIPSLVDDASRKASLQKPIPKSNDTAYVSALLAPKLKKPTVPLPTIKPIDSEEEAETKRRFRPASFLVSTLAHVVVLILLGVATLATKQPKDQLAFTSSAAESSEETMETFAIESNEPMEETEPIPTESAYEISTVGTIAVTEVSMDLPPAPTPPTTSDFLNSSSSSLSSSAMKSLKSDTKMKSQFCGVDGGGSHFVYLVDSSGSMRDGFQSARTELLASIDQLKPDQRFYVVFFDEDPDYMRISDSNADESGSVMATPENKQRLRKWAMTVEMNRGKAPYDILPFALTLRPDVIFLLSDGEFPVKIEEILQVQNRQENLFGESGPISIVHTIRYHGIEGETGRKAEDTMIKIAKENGGQYRHVPKPK